MPPSVKPWINFGGTSTPIDSTGLIGLEYRVGNYVGSSEIGTGVGGYEDYRVKQSGAGNMSVDVGLAATQMRAVLPGDGVGGTQRYDYSSVQQNAIVTTANATNPRIDIVTLAPPGSLDSPLAVVLVVAGTPTPGATLANRSGAAALPAGRILLADVLVPASATQILSAQITDRRGFFAEGAVAPLFTGADLVVPQPAHPGMPLSQTGAVQGTGDNQCSAMQLWLPRRINLARLRWKYIQGGTAASSNYQWFVYDAEGVFVGATAAIAFSGAAASGHPQNDPLTTPVQLEAGACWIAFQLATMGAGASVLYSGWNGNETAAVAGSPAPNLFSRGAGGALSASVASRLAALTSDTYAQTSNAGTGLPVPAVAFGA